MEIIKIKQLVNLLQDVPLSDWNVIKDTIDTVYRKVESKKVLNEEKYFLESELTRVLERKKLYKKIGKKEADEIMSTFISN